MRWWLIVVILAGLVLAAWVVYEDTRNPLSCASLMADRASPDATAFALDENATRSVQPAVASMLDAAVSSGHGTVPTNEGSLAGHDFLTHQGWTGPDQDVEWQGQTVLVKFSTC